jgi:hypothetical protein
MLFLGPSDADSNFDDRRIFKARTAFNLEDFSEEYKKILNEKDSN